MTKKTKTWVIVGSSILLLSLLNPSLKDFEEYKGGRAFVKREGNFLIFSIYRTYDARYVGFLKNFLFIKKVPPQH